VENLSLPFSLLRSINIDLICVRLVDDAEEEEEEREAKSIDEGEVIVLVADGKNTYFCYGIASIHMQQREGHRHH